MLSKRGQQQHVVAAVGTQTDGPLVEQRTVWWAGPPSNGRTDSRSLPREGPTPPARALTEATSCARAKETPPRLVPPSGGTRSQHAHWREVQPCRGQPPAGPQRWALNLMGPCLVARMRILGNQQSPLESRCGTNRVGLASVPVTMTKSLTTPTFHQSGEEICSCGQRICDWHGGKVPPSWVTTEVDQRREISGFARCVRGAGQLECPLLQNRTARCETVGPCLRAGHKAAARSCHFRFLHFEELGLGAFRGRDRHRGEVLRAVGSFQRCQR